MSKTNRLFQVNPRRERDVQRTTKGDRKAAHQQARTQGERELRRAIQNWDALEEDYEDEFEEA